MSERAAFTNSIRKIANVMLGDDKLSAAAQTTPTDESNKPALINGIDEAKSAVPPKHTARKTKQPAALAWLMPRLKVTKQVSVDLPPELDEMVERASHGQRMDKKFPGFKKEIQSVALVEWLERNGWFRPADLEGENTNNQDADT